MPGKNLERASPKLIIATSISGCGEKEYLQRFEEYCDKIGKRVKVFHTADMMFEHANAIGLQLQSKNILDADLDLLTTLRSAALIKVLAEISGETAQDYDAFILCIHAFFFWKKRFTRSYDRYLKEFSPDMYLTFIDDFRHVGERLNERPQWRDENLTAEEVLNWQGVEVEVTSGWAELEEKPFFVIPVEQPSSALYRLIFYPEIEPIYIAMPISHFRGPEDRERINKFIKKLERYFVVFNPLSVEIVGAVFIDSKKEDWKSELAVYHHIVHRDERWFVRQVKKLIVYWPKPIPPKEIRDQPDLAKLWPMAIPSPGVDHETHEAFVKTKDVFVVFLGDEASPFITHYATKIFMSEKELFRFLEEEYPDRKDMKW